MNTNARDLTQLVESDERRLRDIRRGAAVITLGVILVAGSWLMLPIGIIRLSSGDPSLESVLVVVGGAIALVAGIALWTHGLRARRATVAAHSPVTAQGKANPAFDEDRKTVPTGGTPASWAGFTPPGI
jgi:hypothetical protein